MKQFHIGQVVKIGEYFGMVIDARVSPEIKDEGDGVYSQKVLGLDVKIAIHPDKCRPSTIKEREEYFTRLK